MLACNNWVISCEEHYALYITKISPGYGKLKSEKSVFLGPNSKLILHFQQEEIIITGGA